MKFSISNIAWTKEQDGKIYRIMKENGFTGLEIAPTRIFPDSTYDRKEEACIWSSRLLCIFGLSVPSMQSIWYGREEKIFGTFDERRILLEYTKKAIDFAVAIGCTNLVFGCPRNRNIPQRMVGSNAVEEIALPFFKQLGDYAYENGTVISIEANPPVYNTNYINDTAAAIGLIEKVNSKGILLNLDTGTMIENGEPVGMLAGKVGKINHVHISEPGLNAIKERKMHRELMNLLEKEGYDGFVSVEMGKQEDISVVEKVITYVGGLLN